MSWKFIKNIYKKKRRKYLTKQSRNGEGQGIVKKEFSEDCVVNLHCSLQTKYNYSEMLFKF